MRSLLNGTAVGIKLKGSNEFIVSAVTDFESGNDREKWIEIKPHTLYGKPVSNRIIPLSRIEKVVSYSVHYDDPLYARLREIKARILGNRITIHNTAVSGMVLIFTFILDLA